MKFALSTIIIDAKCRIAALLDFGNDESRANRMNCAGWNEKAVTRENSPPDRRGWISSRRRNSVLGKAPIRK